MILFRCAMNTGKAFENSRLECCYGVFFKLLKRSLLILEYLLFIKQNDMVIDIFSLLYFSSMYKEFLI